MRLNVVSLLVVTLVAMLPAPASAQEPCSINTITGTYAVQISGSSFVGTLAPTAAPYQLHGGTAAFVARLTIERDGSVQGLLWGVYVAAPVSGPFSAQVTVNEDCTGDLVTPDESFKFAILDNGKQLRWSPWDGFGGSLAAWNRISPAGEVGAVCGQQMFTGEYVMRCEGYELTGEDSGVASAWSLALLSVKEDGAITGKMYAKRFGLPSSTQLETALSGAVTVNTDCTTDQELTLEVQPGLSLKGRGVLFDHGKQAFTVPLGLYAGDQNVAPVLPLTCQVTLIRK